MISTTVDFNWSNPTKHSGGSRSPVSEPNAIVLRENARMFIIMRWAVAGVLTTFQVISFFGSSILAAIGIHSDGWWPQVIAIILTASNIWHRHLIRPGRLPDALFSIRMQMVTDLVCLSIIVHFVGSVLTPAPFLFTLHIVLSCILLSFRGSLFIALFSCTAYSACLAVEQLWIGPHSIVADFTAPARLRSVLIWGGALQMLFLTIWFVVSRLAFIVHTREQELEQAYSQIRTTQEEKDRYAIQMTHQLKAPLDAIRSTLNLISGGYSGELSAETAVHIAKVNNRARNMAELVVDVLKLSRAKATRYLQAPQPIKVGTMLGECVEKQRPVATGRDIRIETRLNDFGFIGVPEQIDMLLDNLLSNAIKYSNSGGTVRVESVAATSADDAHVTISDKGIGIGETELPHIFDEFYRTQRAITHNCASSGIGLAIVKMVATSHGIRLTVSSESGKGTSFSVYFPDTRAVTACAGETS